MRPKTKTKQDDPDSCKQKQRKTFSSSITFMHAFNDIIIVILRHLSIYGQGKAQI